jgi:hypothetical protein
MGLARDIGVTQAGVLSEVWYGVQPDGAIRDPASRQFRAGGVFYLLP